jgi:hypothetical protein
MRARLGVVASIRARLGIVASLIVALGLLAPHTGSALVPLGWVQDSWGIPPVPTPTTADLTKSYFITPVRRIVPEPLLPARFVMGSSIFGLYESVSGGGWTTLTPNCLSPVRPPSVHVGSLNVNSEELLGMLSGCGIEGIAFDPHDPLALYVTTYNIDIFAPGFPVTYGGIFKAELKIGSFGVSSGGIVWRKILGGVRGNAIAVSHPQASGPVSIVAGRIQRTTGDIGVDSNTSCGPGCQPSVYVSTNGGTSWTAKTFSPQPACDNNTVLKSSKLVGNISFDPNNADVVYASANSGLWYTTTLAGGGSWTRASGIPDASACGSSGGIAVTRFGPSRRVYYGGHDGTIWTSSAGATGPGAFTKLTLSKPIADQVLSVIIDERDDSERTLFVSSWKLAGGPAGGGGVYKVVDKGDGSATVTDLKLSVLDPENFPTGFRPTVQAVKNQVEALPLPYPLFFDPRWRSSLFLAQHPLAPDLLYAATVFGGAWVRSEP